jgi:NAD(P)-dependent dehydrogenase (short-subunit alcohol dehydrogenase family)
MMLVPSDDLAGQIAIVTGGGGGIGRATCLALAREGAQVIVVDRDPASIEATRNAAKALVGGCSLLGLTLDVRRDQDMETMARETLASFGRIDILVAAAEVQRKQGGRPKPLINLTTDEWYALIEPNLTGLFLSYRAVLPTMITQRYGQIINISSTLGRRGQALHGAYCASKFGGIGLSESLAEEVRQYGIRVHMVLPDSVAARVQEQNRPTQRPGDVLADRIAEFAIYLLKLPPDAVILNPVITPFRRRGRRGHQTVDQDRESESGVEQAGKDH